MEKHNLEDNSLVWICGREIYINSRRVTGFEGQDRVLLVVLGRLAQTNPGALFKGSEVLEFMLKHQQLLARFNWSIPRTSAALYQSATKLRKVLDDAGVSPNLLESIRKGDGGYRLSTPSINVTFNPPWGEEGDAVA